VVIEKPLSGVDALSSAATAARSKISAAPSSPGPPPPPNDSINVSSSSSNPAIPVNTVAANSSGARPVSPQLSSWFFQKPGVHDDVGAGTVDDDGGSSADTGDATAIVAATPPTAIAAAAPTSRAVLTVLMVPPLGPNGDEVHVVQSRYIVRTAPRDTGVTIGRCCRFTRRRRSSGGLRR
jgi:hypothetical protein